MRLGEHIELHGRLRSLGLMVSDGSAVVVRSYEALDRGSRNGGPAWSILDLAEVGESVRGCVYREVVLERICDPSLLLDQRVQRYCPNYERPIQGVVTALLGRVALEAPGGAVSLSGVLEIRFDRSSDYQADAPGLEAADSGGLITTTGADMGVVGVLIGNGRGENGIDLGYVAPIGGFLDDRRVTIRDVSRQRDPFGIRARLVRNGSAALEGQLHAEGSLDLGEFAEAA